MKILFVERQLYANLTTKQSLFSYYRNDDECLVRSLDFHKTVKTSHDLLSSAVLGITTKTNLPNIDLIGQLPLRTIEESSSKHVLDVDFVVEGDIMVVVFDSIPSYGSFNKIQTLTFLRDLGMALYNNGLEPNPSMEPFKQNPDIEDVLTSTISHLSK